MNFVVKANKEKKDLEKKIKKTAKLEFMVNLKSDSSTADFECEHCDARLKTQDQLRNHVRVLHVCNSSTQTKEKVMETKFVQCEFHGVVHTKEAEEKVSDVSYKCNDCENTFNSDLSLKNHRSLCLGFGTRNYSSLNQNPVQNLMSLPIGFPLTPFSPWPPYPPHSR